MAAIATRCTPASSCLLLPGCLVPGMVYQISFVNFMPLWPIWYQVLPNSQILIRLYRGVETSLVECQMGTLWHVASTVNKRADVKRYLTISRFTMSLQCWSLQLLYVKCLSGQCSTSRFVCLCGWFKHTAIVVTHT